MTPRRRFFPSTPLQRVPGRTVDLALQLTKGGQAALNSASTTPPDTGGIVGVALFPALLPAESYYGDVLFAVSGMRFLETVFRPLFDGWRLTGGYVPILSPDSQSMFDAVVIGQAAGAVTWSWELSTPDLPPYNFHDPMDEGVVSWDGVTVEQRDGSLRITILSGNSPISGPPWWADLTCIASLGGQEIGRIVVRPGFVLNAYMLPPLNEGLT